MPRTPPVFAGATGDYFHWVPSADTDVSQGIGMGTSTGSTYFMPECVAKDDGSADVDDLERSFNVARTRQPEAMFDVMVRASHYTAVSAESARQIEQYVSDHGETRCELADETWVTSVAQWMGSHWDVLVDLWSVESGRSDMVLDARVSETNDGFLIEIHLVYVP